MGINICNSRQHPSKSIKETVQFLVKSLLDHPGVDCRYCLWERIVRGCLPITEYWENADLVENVLKEPDD
ncbi:MAG: hypothetical protein DRH50_07030 [Deltaproteobacteria bacterium]|nr:MAG: hypothetical protein DRH50_07030 [Deltaproteobacteria bacterium]